MLEMWEEVGEQVLGEDADVGPNMVVQDQSGGNSRLVLPPSPPALPVRQAGKHWRGHPRGQGCRSGFPRRVGSGLLGEGGRGAKLRPHVAVWKHSARERGEECEGAFPVDTEQREEEGAPISSWEEVAGAIDEGNSLWMLRFMADSADGEPLASALRRARYGVQGPVRRRKYRSTVRSS